MKNKFDILFIDDELQGQHSRRQLIDLLNQDPRLSVDAYHPVEILKKLKEGLEKDYTLFVIDYKLNGSPNESGEFSINNGYSLTSLFKEKFPDVPVYLVSQILQVDYSMGEHYDKMLSHYALTTEDGRNLLVSDSSDYEYLREKFVELDSSDKIADLLNVPSESRSAFFSSLPVEFKNGLKKKSQNSSSSVLDKETSFIRFSKWLNEYLLVRSGPLLGESEISLLFGVRVDCFRDFLLKEYAEEFLSCQYNGVFSRTNKPMWWSQSAFDLAVKLADEDYISEPWKKIPNKLEIEEKFWAKCQVCKEFFPECIAYDPDDEEEYNVHWRCALVADDKEDVPGFNPVYYIDDDLG